MEARTKEKNPDQVLYTRQVKPTYREVVCGRYGLKNEVDSIVNIYWVLRIQTPVAV